MRVWHKPANETETHGQTQPWYFQPENAREAQTTPVLAAAPVTVTPTHFEPDAAERILARAGLLQETHRQNLSKEQVEAIAAEIGIAPEFVRLAMEQEAAGVLPRQEVLVSTGTAADLQPRHSFNAATMALYGVFGTAMLTLMRHHSSPGISGFLLFLAFVPAVLALVSGLYHGGRRRSLAWGAGYGMMAITAGILSWQLSDGPIHFSGSDYPLFAAMIGVGALLGFVGAETRRQVFRRRVRNRGRRIVRRTETP